jgi:hypothetical protein
MRCRAAGVAAVSAGPVLAVIAPGTASPATPEEQVLVVAWAAAVGLWGWVVGVGALHAWATRRGHHRWRRVTAALLPLAVRRVAERLAVAGLLVVPVAACGPGAEPRPAPVLVLEATIPLSPSEAVVPSGPGASTPPSAAATTSSPPAEAGRADQAHPGPGSVPPVAPPDGGAPPGNPGPGSVPPVAPPAPSGGAGRPGTGADEPAGTPGDTPAEGTSSDRSPADRATAPPGAPVVVPAGEHVVVEGEHLWSIAAARVRAHHPEPSLAVVTEYWLAVVAENRQTLRSGDPDLVHPGEVLRLPELAS